MISIEMENRLTGNRPLITGLICILALISTLVTHIDRVAAAADTPTLADIKVAFMLDRRLTRSMYMGDRWVSPPTYTSTVHAGKQLTVEARAHGIDGKGRRVEVDPEWIPEDPEMVTVSPGAGGTVKITVRRAGQSRLKIALPELSRELLIRATEKDGTIQASISR